jgi:hypothetical protein
MGPAEPARQPSVWTQDQDKEDRKGENPQDVAVRVTVVPLEIGKRIENGTDQPHLFHRGLARHFFAGLKITR